MADILTGVRTYLLTRSTVTALVGERIYPDEAPQSVTAAHVLLSDVSSESYEHLNGCSGLAETRVQVSCRATTRQAANDLREAIRLVMQGRRGTYGACTVRACRVAGRASFYEPPQNKTDVGRYTRSIDFLITHFEAQPSI